MDGETDREMDRQRNERTETQTDDRETDGQKHGQMTDGRTERRTDDRRRGELIDRRLSSVTITGALLNKSSRHVVAVISPIYSSCSLQLCSLM